MKTALKRMAAAAIAAVTAVFGAALPHSAGTALAAEISVQEEDTLTVSLLVLGDAAHEVTDDNKHTLSGGGLTEWLRGDFKASADDTVWDVVKAAFEKNDITFVNESGSYLESASKDGVTLGGSSNGDLCGWMYNLNGGFAMNGMAEQPLADGDRIVLYFTDDFYAEDGSEHPSYGTTGNKPETPEEPPVKPVVKYDLAEMYKAAGDALLADLTAADFPSGTEWTVMGLARDARTIPDVYYNNVLEYVSSKIDENGKLSRTGATENARFILALTALGYDVTDVDGNDLLRGLSELEYVTKQGANGAIWALIALDSGRYDIPKAKNGTQTTREALVDAVLAARLEDGGWAYSGSTADPDLTAMALTALAPYIGGSVDKTVADKALALLSEAQTEKGGFGGEDGTYSESCAQVLTALTAIGIDPITDERFIKNGCTVLDAMAELYENGKFRHTADGELNTLSTEQCFYAMAAYERFTNGKNTLYDMTDTAKRQPVPDDEQNNDSSNSVPETPNSGNSVPDTVPNPDCGVPDCAAVVVLTAAAFMAATRKNGK